MTGLAYTGPNISVVNLGAATPISGTPGGKVVLALGNAPKGPNFPVLCNPGDVVSLFGDPASPASTGYSLPLGLYFLNMQHQPASNTPVQYLVCRTWVTNATITVNDSTAGPALTFTGIGQYAGSAGNHLQVVIVGSSSAATSITINEVIGSVTTQKQKFTNTNYNLGSIQAIVNAINGANPVTNTGSVISVTAGTSITAPAPGTYALTTGADGLTQPNSGDDTATLLSQSLWTHADYMWLGRDAATVASALITHIGSEALKVNEVRKAFVGPKAGTTFASLSGSYANSYAGSSRVIIAGHDAAFALNPVTNLPTLYDGIYLGAALCGLKAVGPTHETGTQFPIAGFLALAAPPDATSYPFPLSPTNMDTLAGNGYTVLYQPLGSSQIVVREMLTNAAYANTDGSSVNPFSQANVQDIDDSVTLAAIFAVRPFIGRPGQSLDDTINFITNAVSTQLGRISQNMIGDPIITVSQNPATLIVTVAIAYVTRYPYRQIIITTSFTF